MAKLNSGKMENLSVSKEKKFSEIEPRSLLT